jgi:hypothetical protein
MRVNALMASIKTWVIQMKMASSPEIEKKERKKAYEHETSFLSKCPLKRIYK